MVYIQSQYKKLSYLVLILTILFFSSFYFGSMFFSKLKIKYNSLISLTSQNEILETKIETLKAINDTLPTSDDIVLALPQSNNLAISIANMREVIGTNQLSLKNIRNTSSTSVTDSTGITVNTFSADLTSSDFTSVLNLLKSFETFSPLTAVVKADIARSMVSTDVTARLEVAVYSSNFPQEISHISELVNDLTADERDLLISISGLKKPQMIQLQPSFLDTRTNPFVNTE